MPSQAETGNPYSEIKYNIVSSVSSTVPWTKTNCCHAEKGWPVSWVGRAFFSYPQ